MNRAKYTSRLIFFLLAVLLLVYLNGKTNDNAESVAEFKFKMFQKLRTDSLDSKRKVELLVNETKKFVDDSSRVRKGIHYLSGLFTLLIVFEVAFLILGGKNYGRKKVE